MHEQPTLLPPGTAQPQGRIDPTLDHAPDTITAGWTEAVWIPSWPKALHT